ncbi:telomere-protecting terminal protein Tpg [Streptomyces sp. NPDC003011]
MGEFEDTIERADREAFTKEPPKSLKGQIGSLLKQFGSARAVAAELGVTADSVNGYRRGARKHASAYVARRATTRYGPAGSRWCGSAGSAGRPGGSMVGTRARFTCTAPVGTTDDGRFRRLTVHRTGRVGDRRAGRWPLAAGCCCPPGRRRTPTR